VIPFPALAVVPDEYCSVSFPIDLHTAVATSRRRHRALIAAAGEWALGRGVPLPADHVALWAATAEDSGCHGDVDATTGPWRASHMPDFLATTAAWCTLAGCPTPPNLAESLWHLYGFLAATDRLDPSSDSLHELRAAVVVFAGSDRICPIAPPPTEPTAA
jgi:hypothetical protein